MDSIKGRRESIVVGTDGWINVEMLTDIKGSEGFVVSGVSKGYRVIDIPRLSNSNRLILLPRYHEIFPSYFDIDLTDK